MNLRTLFLHASPTVRLCPGSLVHGIRGYRLLEGIAAIFRPTSLQSKIFFCASTGWWKKCGKSPNWI
jgi:hypothetical protein